MCGLFGIVGAPLDDEKLHAVGAQLHHRGPDRQGRYRDPTGRATLLHTRLRILDLSSAGDQPMADPSGRRHLIFKGEIYNDLALRDDLRHHHRFRTHADTEALLAALERWGPACLHRLLGMFAFLRWDEDTGQLFAARDRFGVKPLYYHRRTDGSLLLASEIKALHAAGVPAEADPDTWADYLVHGRYGRDGRTFWRGVEELPPGHHLTWCEGELSVARWYDVVDDTGPAFDTRDDREVADAYLALATESVRLRFRADVPVGINLSGGLDSSTLLALVQRIQGTASTARAFTFVCGDERYDELPWVRAMLARTHHPLTVCTLDAAQVPDLAADVQAYQDEPFGGLPTLAYARLFEEARREGVIVLLDGQGMDEQWAGYDYYARHAPGAATSAEPVPVVQGSRDAALRPDCLVPAFRARARAPTPPTPFDDPVRDLQVRDLCRTKLPRALRFNDRVSMRASCELREPFLDHRLVTLALRQPTARKLRRGEHKWLLRRLAQRLVPHDLVEAPKRPLQTPQREWLRGPLRAWTDDLVERALRHHGGSWLEPEAVRRAWHRFRDGEGDNSFFVWQWLNLGMMER